LMSPCLHVFTSPCFHVSMSSCLHVSTSPCFHVSMSSCLHLNSNFQLFAANGKQKRQTSFCLPKTEVYFPWLANNKQYDGCCCSKCAIHVYIYAAVSNRKRNSRRFSFIRLPFAHHYIGIYFETAAYIYIYPGNGRKTTTSVCLLQAENGNVKFPFLFGANGNGKRKFVFSWSANNTR
jgi:hypothetical protein